MCPGSPTLQVAGALKRLDVPGGRLWYHSSYWSRLFSRGDALKQEERFLTRQEHDLITSILIKAALDAPGAH